MNCYRKISTPSGRQSGAALIIAIFVLALAMIMITAMSTRFAVAARRTDNQILADQAWYYLTGAEQLATELLLQQMRDRAEKQLDGFFRPELFGQFDTDHGWLAFSVVDLQGRFNINSLTSAATGASPIAGAGTDPAADLEVGVPLTPDATPESLTPVPRNLAQQRFIRLLLSVEEPQLSEPEAVAILEALVDWLDKDTMETGFGGAEQMFYSRQTPPYRPADLPMRDISELLMVKGITPQLYQVLRDSLTIWPREGGPVSVAGADVALIQALYDKENLVPMEIEKAMAIVAAIREGEVTTMEDFLNRPEWGAEALVAQDLTGSSELFIVSSQTQVGRIRQAMDSVIRIRDDKAEILARSMRML